MGAQQREPVLMLVDLLNGDGPALYAVALFAIGPKLAPVKVGVAIRAALPHIGEYRLDVALRTRHAFVHAAQRIAGLVVIELWDRTDRLPPGSCMTVLTGQVQISMWAMRSGVRLSLCAL